MASAAFGGSTCPTMLFWRISESFCKCSTALLPPSSLYTAAVRAVTNDLDHHGSGAHPTDPRLAQTFDIPIAQIVALPKAPLFPISSQKWIALPWEANRWDIRAADRFQGWDILGTQATATALDGTLPCHALKDASTFEPNYTFKTLATTN